MQNFLILRELQTEFLKFKTHFAKISYKKTECMTDFMHFLVFLANRAKILYVNSGDYHLSIGIEKSRFWALFVIFDFLGPDKGRCPTGASKPDQKFDPPGGNFGSPVISKSCFQLF